MQKLFFQIQTAMARSRDAMLCLCWWNQLARCPMLADRFFMGALMTVGAATAALEPVLN
jgi:hypothetical protein